jgi:hypothetical protein
MTDGTISKIAANRADELVERTYEPGCTNTDTGRAWTPEERYEYRRQIVREETARLTDESYNDPDRIFTSLEDHDNWVARQALLDREDI